MPCLNDYLVKHQITLSEFCRVTGQSRNPMQKIRYDGEGYNPTARTMEEIYLTTLDKYGEGLSCWDLIPDLKVKISFN